MNRSRRCKGQVNQASQTSDDLHSELEGSKNQTAYLETLLAFEERSVYSSIVSQQQLERRKEPEAGIIIYFGEVT